MNAKTIVATLLSAFSVTAAAQQNDSRQQYQPQYQPQYQQQYQQPYQPQYQPQYQRNYGNNQYEQDRLRAEREYLRAQREREREVDSRGYRREDYRGETTTIQQQRGGNQNDSRQGRSPARGETPRPAR